MLIAESNYLRQLLHHHLDYCITVAGFTIKGLICLITRPVASKGQWVIHHTLQ